jgi:PAS domain S-box-containing protein
VGGEVVGRVWSFRDVTERARSEEALRASEERFRELAENVREVFFVFNRDASQLVYVSPGSSRLIGLPPEEVRAAWPGWMERSVHAEDLPGATAMLASAVAGEVAEGILRVTHRDGSVRWLESRLVPVRDAAGRVQRILGSASDITTRKQAEDALHREERMAMLGSLSAGVAHEINNPLGFIKSNLQFLLRGMERALARGDLPAGLREEMAEAVASMQDNMMGVERIERIVKSLRQLAKPSTRAQPVQLNGVVESALVLASNRTRNSIEVQADLQPDLPLVLGGADELGQVLLNLVLNAADAVPSPGGRIVVRTRREGDQVVVTVADNGPGIPRPVQERMFTPFYTTKQHGTGLGLAISRRIIEDHHGALRFTTAPGAGTTFTLSLPVLAADAPPVPEAPHHAP